MQREKTSTAPAIAQTALPSRLERFGTWIQEPMGGVIAASVATMSSLGIVLSGSWAISLALN
jgi:hypothetical protein